MSQPVLILTPRGLYCPAGDFYIDPHRPVEQAVITHAHSDHARRGSRHYFCVETTVELLRCRLGSSIAVKTYKYGEKIRFGSAWVSFHPAGHILGSAQVRVEVGNQVWVASGDYKRDADPTCEPFEVVQCDAFVTEATFGTPSFVWKKDATPGLDIYQWWKKNAEAGRNSIVYGYSLGKAQRILGEVRPFIRQPVLIHSTIDELSQCYRRAGIPLAETEVLGVAHVERTLRGELIVVPPSANIDAWTDAFGPYAQHAFASGWMGSGSRGWGRGQDYDHGFVISDHADWEDLNRTILETGARRIYVQHRGNGALVRHLRGLGLNANPVEVLEAPESSVSQLNLF